MASLPSPGSAESTEMGNLWLSPGTAESPPMPATPDDPLAATTGHSSTNQTVRFFDGGRPRRPSSSGSGMPRATTAPAGGTAGLVGTSPVQHDGAQARPLERYPFHEPRAHTKPPASISAVRRARNTGFGSTTHLGELDTPPGAGAGVQVRPSSRGGGGFVPDGGTASRPPSRGGATVAGAGAAGGAATVTGFPATDGTLSGTKPRRRSSVSRKQVAPLHAPKAVKAPVNIEGQAPRGFRAQGRAGLAGVALGVDATAAVAAAASTTPAKRGTDDVRDMSRGPASRRPSGHLHFLPNVPESMDNATTVKPPHARCDAGRLLTLFTPTCCCCCCCLHQNLIMGEWITAFQHEAASYTSVTLRNEAKLKHARVRSGQAPGL